MDLELLQMEIYDLLKDYNTFLDEIPLLDENNKELDYQNKIYISYCFRGISDGMYRKDISLDINLVTNTKNKISLQKQAIEIDEKLNRKMLTNSRIVRQNGWYVNFKEDEKENIILQYFLITY